jgi:hypothetical protein
MPADEDELTELTDADFPRVDLVGKGANGIPRFLIAKQDGAAGLLEPDFVRGLIAKAEPGREPSGGEQVTMTGTPAAIASLINGMAGAPVRKAAEPSELQAVAKHAYPGGTTEVALAKHAYDLVVKAKYDAADRKRMAGSGAAMEDGSYPIADKEDVTSAVRAVGRGGADHDAIRRHVIKRAKAVGASSEIPDNWAADGSLKEAPVAKSDPVAKDMGPELDDGADGLDPTVPLAAPADDSAPGDPADPGSPAWEAIDAATAGKWTSILARARVAIDILAEREMLEAASADPDDAENAWDLQDVCCAIDYAISVLAPFAVAEQSEADCGADAMAAIGKAMAGFGAVPMDRIEVLSLVTKAGRVLSAANEAEIRTAAASLQKVLTSLPSAPVADEQPVSKESAMPEAPAQTAAPDAPAQAAAQPDTAPAEVTKAAALPVLAWDKDGAPVTISPAAISAVIKADEAGKPAQVAVYDADGNLVGVADPADITPLANVKAPGGNDDAPADDSAPAEDAPADAADMTPAPPADAGTPADGTPDDDVAKADAAAPETSTTTDAHDVLKSLVTEAVTAVLDARTPAEDIAKQADVAGLRAEVEVLKGRLVTVENSPAAPKVFSNGQVPPAGQMRGQDQGAAAHVDIAKAAALRAEFRSADPAEQNRLAAEMQQAAIGHLAALHGRT